MAKNNNAITVSQVPRLVNDFQNEICHYSENVASMKWDEKSSYQLMSKPPYVTKTTVHDRLVPVVKLKNGFYIYASMSFATEGKSRKRELSNLSMHFFDESDLLFRAEVANPKFHREETGHPQPHWHIAGNRKKSIEKQQDSFMEFVGETELSFSSYVGDTNEEAKFDYSRLHLAMNYSNLELDTFDENSIRAWIKQCLKTVNDEFTFLSTKKHTFADK
jgi:hypothetical protein